MLFNLHRVLEDLQKLTTRVVLGNINQKYETARAHLLF